MPVRRLVWLALLLALLPMIAAAQPVIPDAAVLVPADAQVQHDLATLNRPIVVLGLVEGDVTSWVGDIRIEGQVRGDVITYAGTVQLGPAAVVGGSILAPAGAELPAGAQLAGAVFGAEPFAGGLLASSIDAFFARPTLGVALSRGLLALAFALMTLMLTLACTLVWPLRTAGIARTLVGAPLRSLVLGILSTLVLLLLVPPLATLLALSLIGLPLVLVGLVLLQAPYLIGLAGVARALALRLPFTQGADHPAAVALGVVVLLLPLVLLGMLLPLGVVLLLFYLIAGAGFGAALLSRGGAYAIG